MAVLLVALAWSSVAWALDKPLPGKPDVESGVKIEKLTLVWGSVAGAESYRVQMSTDPQFATLLPLEKADAIKGNPAKTDDVTYTVALAAPEKILPSTRYYWRVIAQCPPADATCTESTSDTAVFQTELSAKFLSSRGISLTLGRDSDKLKKPASFKYAYSKEKGEVYTANYTLIKKWTARPLSTNNDFLQHTIFHDGSLSSDPKATDTAIRFGYQAVYDHSFAQNRSLTARLALLNESNQNYDTGKNLAELSGTPSSQGLAIGYGIPLAGGNVEFLWEPTVTLTYGRTVKIGDSTEVRDTIQRYALRLATTWDLIAVADRLNTRRVALLVAGTAWKLPNEEIDEHDLLEATLQFDFTDNLSVGLDYKRGEQPPEFKGIKNYGLSIGVKF